MSLETKQKKFYGARRAIVERAHDGSGFVLRILSCGHRVAEPDGGKAAEAQFALCRECSDAVTHASR